MRRSETSGQIPRLKRATAALVIPTSLTLAALTTGCSEARPEEPQTTSSEFAYQIGSSNLTDWFKCGTEGSTTCYAGYGGKYMAYGANGKFRFQDVPPGPVRCTNEEFGGDPIPGVVKDCYMSSLTLIARLGETITPSIDAPTHPRGIMTMAFGGGNGEGEGMGLFNILEGLDTSQQLRCSTDYFRLPQGAKGVSGCYQVLSGYKGVTIQGGSMTVGNMAPIAVGANGSYFYKRTSGTFTCDPLALFGADPAPGYEKICYVLELASNEVPTPEGGYFWTGIGAMYTSGSWSNVIYKTYTGSYRAHYCSNSEFDGDPEYGQPKYCYPIPQAPI